MSSAHSSLAFVPLPEPLRYEPPWMETSTGSNDAFLEEGSRGVCTLTNRQSSSCRLRQLKITSSAASPSGETPNKPPSGSCKHFEKLSAWPSLTPSHGSARSGGRHRREPVGGAAYGIPQKQALQAPGECDPRTAPPSVDQHS